MGTNDRITMAREMAGLSQSELARRLGVTPQAVQQWEKEIDPTSPRGKRLKNLSSILGVTQEWILFGKQSLKIAGKSAQYNQDNTLSEDEQLFLEKYRQLTPQAKDQASAMLDVLAQKKRLKT